MPSSARHADVHQHDVRAMAVDRGQHLVAVGRLGHDLDPLLRGEHQLQPGAQQRVVVDEQDADGGHHGSVARSTKEPSARRAEVQRPAGELDPLGDPDQPGARARQRARRPTRG